MSSYDDHASRCYQWPQPRAGPNLSLCSGALVNGRRRTRHARQIMIPAPTQRFGKQPRAADEKAKVSRCQDERPKESGNRVWPATPASERAQQSHPIEHSMSSAHGRDGGPPVDGRCSEMSHDSSRASERCWRSRGRRGPRVSPGELSRYDGFGRFRPDDNNDDTTRRMSGCERYSSYLIRELRTVRPDIRPSRPNHLDERAHNRTMLGRFTRSSSSTAYFPLSLGYCVLGHFTTLFHPPS